MSMERWELAKRQEGNIAAAEMAKTMREQFGDVPLPTLEAPLEIKRFTPEDRKKLEKAGLRVIYALTGQSIKTERDAGRPFWSDWHQSYPSFEGLPSRLSEVAINSDKLFLQGSNRKTLPQQEEMVENYSQELQRKLKTTGMKAVIGEAADYVELAFTHPSAPNERLFGKRHNFDFARTKTPIEEGSPRVALVGNFVDVGLYVDGWGAGGGHGALWAAPLVVPAS